MNESVILYIEDVDLNMLPISILDSTPVILYIEDVDLNLNFLFPHVFVR